MNDLEHEARMILREDDPFADAKQPVLVEDTTENTGTNGGFRSALYCSKPYNARFRLKREQLHHRMFAIMKAQGFSITEIAEQTGYSPATIHITLAQPWVQEMVLEELNRAGRKKIDELLDAQVIPSLQKIISIRDNPDAPIREQRCAANDILDRVFGKPNQPMSFKHERDLSKLSDDELKQIIASDPTTATATDGPSGEAVTISPSGS